MTKAPGDAALRKLQHEMRTPLGQIIGYSEMLKEEARDRALDDLVPDLERIERAARTLLTFVSDVLDSRPGAPVDLREVREAAARRAAHRDSDSEREAGADAERDGHLLVVDDELDNRDLLSRRLERCGYRVSCAGEGAQALRIVESEEVDLVLLDVLMPGMSGLEVLDAIRRTRSSAQLPVIMATALGRSEDTVAALERGANDYVTKPLDLPVVLARVESQLSLRRAAGEIESLAQQLALHNTFIRRIFGRYVSDEVVRDLLERPEGLELRGEKRRVTILLADLRGFSSHTEALAPTETVALLNGYLGAMSEVIQSYGGTIDEFLGDGILAFFGAPVAKEDDAERAVTCAVAMQRAMASVNERNRRRGLPEVEMGVGVSTGDVVVGNIGSEKRTKYGAVGSPVNLAGRIESYTLGGEIWISETTRRALGPVAEITAQRDVHPKGLEAPIRIHRVSGIGGATPLRLDGDASEFVTLDEAIPVRFALLEGKHVGSVEQSGEIWALSTNAAKLRAKEAVPELADLRIELGDDASGASYAKVVSGASAAGGSFTVRFTTTAGPLRQRLEALRGSAAPGS